MEPRDAFRICAKPRIRLAPGPGDRDRHSAGLFADAACVFNRNRGRAPIMTDARVFADWAGVLGPRPRPDLHGARAAKIKDRQKPAPELAADDACVAADASRRSPNRLAAGGIG
jgi:hypothetical protein